MKRKPVSKSCKLFELMSMFEKLQTQSIKLKMNYDHLRKNPQKYVPDPKKPSLLQSSRTLFCKYVVNKLRISCINFQLI